MRRPTACPVCSSADYEDAGPVIHSDDFSGTWGETPTVAKLIRCRGCHFAFKDTPAIPADRLAAYYSTVRRTDWGGVESRALEFLPELAARHAAGRRILDIGCAGGEILRSFPAEWEKFGVEPSAHASAIAERNGVTILGTSLETLPPNFEPFDVALLIDVAEHIANPIPFFRRLRGTLKLGGICVVITGDTDAWTWKFEGGLYWYCTLPEHVSFYCRAAMSEVGKRTGFSTVDHRRTAHARFPLAMRLSQALRNVAYIALRKCGGLGVPRLRRRLFQKAAPEWVSARDHMVHVLRAI